MDSSRMKTLLVQLVVFCTKICLCTAKPTQQGSTCSSQNHFIRVHPDGTEECWPCPECPRGQGLSRQCGLKLNWSTVIECEDCKLNKSYSDTHDISTCKPCQECDVTGIVQNCTLESNRVCGSECPKGWFMHPDTDYCHECFFCCESAKEHERRQECKDNGMDINNQCEKTSQNELCKKNSMPPTIQDKENSTPQDGRNNENSQSPLILALILCATIIPGTFVIAFAGYRIWKKVHKRISSCTTDRENGKPQECAKKSSKATNAEVGDGTNRLRTKPLAYTYHIKYSFVPDSDQSSANTSQESLNIHLNGSSKSDEMFQIPDGSTIPKGSSIPDNTGVSMILQMEELLDQLKSLDCKEKPTKKNWRNVGRVLKVSKEKLDAIQCHYQSSSPTEGLLDYFGTLAQQEPTIKTFFIALLKCERYDLAQRLCACSWENINSTQDCRHNLVI